MIKQLLISTGLLIAFSGPVFADQYVNGYYKQDGTYVSGHYKSYSNATNLDNYSTHGNANPYSGQTGYRAGDYSPQSNNYGAGRPIETGPRGGQYYLNDSGRKVYVPKR